MMGIYFAPEENHFERAVVLSGGPVPKYSASGKFLNINSKLIGARLDSPEIVVKDKKTSASSNVDKFAAYKVACLGKD